MLPIVIYAGGPTRWTAASRVIDLVTPTSAPVAGPDLASRASGLFAGDGYLTLDTQQVAADDLRHDNTAALLAALCNPVLDRIPAGVAALRARLDDPRLRELLEVVLLWAQQTARRVFDFDLRTDDMAEIDGLHESDELEDYYAARRRAHKEQIRVEGERDLLLRQARRKFDAGTAERLAGIMADIEDTDGLARVGDLIIDCTSGEELVATLVDGREHTS